MLEPYKMPKVGRVNVVVDLKPVGVICHVEAVEAKPQLAISKSWQVQLELAVYLHIKGEELGEALAIGQAHIVLKRVDIRIRQSRTNIDHGTERELPGQAEGAPAHQAIGNIR